MLKLAFGRWAKRQHLRSFWKSPAGRDTLPAEVSILEQRTLLTATPLLVKDINPVPWIAASDPENIVRVGEKVFFTASTQLGGRELYVSDGTMAGTVQVKDIYPGGHSLPQDLVEFNGELYFTATHGAGRGLWKSDGTESGTVRVDGIASGMLSPSLLAAVNGTLYFTAYSFANGNELWRTDGTTEGTFRIKNIRPGDVGSYPQNFTDVNGTLFFTAIDGVGGRELWKSDGTEAGTVRVKDIFTGSTGSDPQFLTNVNGTLYFAATNSASGTELWKSDGTEAGTVRVKDIATGSSSPQSLLELNGTLYFTATDEARGRELWKSDGTEAGTVPVVDLFPGVDGSSPQNLVDMNGMLYFAATDGSGGVELWKSDGTSAGTVRVRDIVAGSGSSTPADLIGADGVLYFSAFDSAGGRELWKSDGTEAGTLRVKDILAGSGDSSPTLMTPVGGVVYFRANDGVSGRELWKTDGTSAGTVLVRDIQTGTAWSYLSELATLNGLLYFSASNGVDGELWKTDGTAAGTVLVKDIFPGTTSSAPEQFKVVNGTLFFSARGPIGGRELWKSDGTAAGTVLVKDINLGSASDPRNLTEVNGLLYFTASDNDGGRELWRSDGTEGGTYRVKDIFQGFPGSDPQYLTNVNGTLYFTAYDGSHGVELWMSDGTAAGTVLVADSVPGSLGAGPRYLMNIGGTLYFRAGAGIDFELWKSDGTASGTVRVKDINPGSFGSSPRNFTDVNGVLFFTASDAAGEELWKSDGTEAGTVRVKDIFPGAGGSIPGISGNILNVGGTLFFTANDQSGHELWKSDGTESGTVRVKDIFVGMGGAGVRALTNVGGLLFFYANDGVAGYELWSTDGTASGTLRVSDAVDVGVPRYGRTLSLLGTRLIFAAPTDLYGEELISIDLGAPPASIGISSMSFPENVTNGAGIGYFNAIDPDAGDTFTYEFVDGTPDSSGNSSFQIVGNQLITSDSFDFESQSSYSIRVRVRDSVGHSFIQTFTLNVADVDEFNVGAITDTDATPNSVSEHAPVGTPVGITTFATDADGTNNGITYSLWNTRGGRFAIDPATGVITVANSALLDREGAAAWSLTVLATSQDGSVSVKEFAVNLIDVDEYNVGNLGDFDPAPQSVAENAPNGTPVGIMVKGFDADATNSAITYSLTQNHGGRFAIDPVTGVVTVANGSLLDREAAMGWSITAKGTSADGSFSLKGFTIALTDVDEYDIGNLGDFDPAPQSVPENSPNGTLVGLTVKGFDADATNSAISYSLTDNAGGRFTIDPTTGVVTVASGAFLDREAAAAWSITVKATSQDGSFHTKAFSIGLSDVDDFDVGPISDLSEVANTVVENATVGTLVGITAGATDGDVTNNTVIYSLTNNAGNRFQIDPATGVVSVAAGAVLDFEVQTSHDITVKATSSDGSTSTGTFTISLTNAFDSPRITLSSNTVAENLPRGATVGTLGLADSNPTSPVYTLVAGPGSTDNSRFTISGNQLRTRVSFNFESKSSYSIRVRMRGAGGVILTQVFTIQVTDAPEGAAVLVEKDATPGPVASFDSSTSDSSNYTLVSGRSRLRASFD